ncbi:MAG: zinc ribbon domain-containing protein [Dissulfurispiraceae bacterium]
MNEQLKLLMELQKLDSSILSTRIQIQEVPAKISSGEAPLKAAQDAHDRAAKSYAALDKKKKDKELELDDINAKINKLKQRAGEIKTNKEYQAHLKEIEKVELDMKAAEDELLYVLMSLEESERMWNKEKIDLANERAKLDAFRKEHEGELSRYKETLKAQTEDRKTLVDSIESSLYNQYMNILRMARGLAVVEAKNEICQGCNIHIPPQLFVELKSTDEIMQCPQCRRILFYLKPENNAKAPTTQSQDLTVDEHNT